MPSPFPGMDPYLENPAIFPNFHLQMISHIQGSLNRVLRPKYLACVEERVYISAEDDPGRKLIIPDVEIRQSSHKAALASTASRRASTAVLDVAEPIIATSLIDDEIHEHLLNVTDVATKKIIAVIEILSPTNKCVGAAGRKQYLTKRRDLMSSESHFIEIDLLRDGKSTFDRDILPAHHYAVHVSRVEMRPKAKFWPILLKQRLPVIDIPLKKGDPDALLDLQAVFNTAYEFGAYDLAIDYGKPPKLPLPRIIQKWAADVCRKSLS
jgi:hypothetical protein